LSDSDHDLQVFFGLGLVLGGPVIQQFVPVRLQITHLTELGEVGHETLAIPLVVGVDYLEVVVICGPSISRSGHRNIGIFLVEDRKHGKEKTWSSIDTSRFTGDSWYDSSLFGIITKSSGLS